MEREQTTIRLPDEVKKDVEKEANIRNISFNSMVNALIVKGLELIKKGHSVL